MAALTSASMLYRSGRMRSFFFFASCWPLTRCCFNLGMVLCSSTSCMMVSESGLSQNPVGAYVAVARIRRARRLALPVWMELNTVVVRCCVSKRRR